MSNAIDTSVPDALLKALHQVARDRSLTFYSDVARLLGIDTSNEHFAVHVGRILDEMNRQEFANGRPLLSALVVSKETMQPGYGYYKCARDLRRYTSKDDDAMWIAELNAVYDYWMRHADQD